MNIFPNLKTGKWKKINLTEESKKTDLDLSNPDVCTDFITNLHKKLKIDYDYGGFLENRTYLWRNSKSEKGKSLIHLGVDYSIPAGTEIALPVNATVFHLMKDPKNNIGWGGRIIFKMEDGNYLLYGHLKQNISLEIGQKCKKGQIVAILGDKNENGNWWPHLHVQIMNQFFIDRYKSDLNKIDGYLPATDSNLKNLINPETTILINSN
ncbi:MAG: peptidoglycan DD-metalloendopeptidase family protein [archaeon]